jgi:multiple sugar transport system substrate-binding protein
VVTPFKSADAEAGWTAMKELWAVSNPNSTNYNFMQEPLLAGEVWIAWDHVAGSRTRSPRSPTSSSPFPPPPARRGEATCR